MSGNFFPTCTWTTTNYRTFHYLKERQFCRLLSSWVPGERLPNIESALSMEEREAAPSLIQHFCDPFCLPLAVLACPILFRYPLWVKVRVWTLVTVIQGQESQAYGLLELKDIRNMLIAPQSRFPPSAKGFIS